MNKAELVDYLAKAADVTKREAKQMVETTINGIVEGLAADGKVTLAGFGSFVLVDREARTARNPKTGEAVDVPAKVVPKFKPSAALKEYFNEDVGDVEGDDVEE